MNLFTPILAAAVALATVDEPADLAVYKAITGTPRAYVDRDEDAKERAARLRDVAVAITAATSSLEERAALVAVGASEALWSSRVGADKCRKGTCDPGKDGKPKALGYFQVHRAACREAFSMAPGLPRLKVEAKCALRVLHWAKPRCKPETLQAAVTGYRGDCRAGDRKLRDKAYEAYHDVLTRGAWPRQPDGWRSAGRVPRETRLRGMALASGLPMGAWLEVDGFGVLVSWHWHDPSGDVSPKGWHRGLTFFRPATEVGS